jgi:formamidopyrimidine-DNA glycosylase
MPELPEVETVRRTLEPHVMGGRIVAAAFLFPRAAQGKPDEMSARLRGRRIVRLRRSGKRLLFDLDHGVIECHLRMTGKLLWNAAAGQYARAVLTLDRGTLVFDDVRQFGYLIWRESDPPLGPDVLELDASEFKKLLRARRGAIKPLLLNQAVIGGVGNIYADESLFRAGIHPLTACARIGPKRAALLFDSIVAILSDSILAGGSSISNYRDAEGRAGSFQNAHQVYGRAGEPCPRCGRPIVRIVVGQRGTHYCPGCQKRR